MRRLAGGLLAVVLATGPASAGGPPPTPVPPAGSPSPYPSVLQTPPPSRRPPKLDIAGAALADLNTGRVLWDRRGGRPRPIASLTKIMTVLLTLEETAPTDEVVVSPRAAAEAGAELGLRTGETVEVDDLVYALMLQSSNDGAVALAEHIGGTVKRFIKTMNRRARQMGLRETRFASPNGLDDRGHSTPRDLAELTAEAFATDGFAEVVATKRHVIPAPDGPARRIQNRNALLWLYRGAAGVKTGFTSAAGFCLVAAAERDGVRLVAVVLGSPDEAFSDAAAILDYGFRAFERRSLVEAGEELAPIRVQGRAVVPRATETVELLLKRNEEVDGTVVPAQGLRLPIAAGAPVGELVLRTEGAGATRVPLVSATTVRPPVRVRPPWWRRYSAAAVPFLLRMTGMAAI